VTGSFICGGIFDLARKKEEVQKLEKRMEESSFWDDQTSAKECIEEAKDLKSWLTPYEDADKRIKEADKLIEEAGSVEDEEFLQELESEIEHELSRVSKDVEALEVRKMLSSELDKNDCFLSINAGAGGVEACDWANMLLRMYQRWVSRRGWKYELVDLLDGEVAGIRNCTIRIIGPFAYGWAKAEKGIHRLVRISPFDSNARRHTSFAAVDVSPEIADDVVIDIRSEDLRVDTFRASGAGGQHVNKTDSAVRITHIPTGVIVTSQAQRSQIKNREYCMKLLRSKLYELELAKRKDTLTSIAGEKKEIGWGQQIRSYVFQPYTLVKDHRTSVERGNVEAVMDGDIDPFILAYLKEFGEV